MPVTANKVDMKLKLTFNTGLDPKTKKEVKKAKTLGTMNFSATDVKLYEVATTLSELQDYEMTDVSRSETYSLTSE